MSAVGFVIAAWTIEGASPRTHRQAVSHVTKNWPELARAVRCVVHDQNEPEALEERTAELVELLTRHRDSMSPEHGVMQWIAGAWPHLHKAFKRLLAEQVPPEGADAEPADEVWWRIEVRLDGTRAESIWHPHGPRIDEEIHVRRMEADLEELRQQFPDLVWRLAKYTVEVVG